MRLSLLDEALQDALPDALPDVLLDAAHEPEAPSPTSAPPGCCAIWTTGSGVRDTS
ncbi:hypothetical protein ACFXDH_35470 [Streptomyces sp. NPDC059467]|uniref:hypothetical protein n=1 Tax=Streptomyces sp. NPDC059467 TaxID=3346844 RepID=UPI0036D1648C